MPCNDPPDRRGGSRGSCEIHFSSESDADSGDAHPSGHAGLVARIFQMKMISIQPMIAPGGLTIFHFWPRVNGHIGRGHTTDGVVKNNAILLYVFVSGFAARLLLLFRPALQ